MIEEIHPKILKKLDSFLATKSRTVYEVQERIRLYLKKYTPEELSEHDKSLLMNTITTYLIEERLLDDSRYAEEFTGFLANTKKSLSPLQIKMFLTKKGLSQKLIQQVLNGLDSTYTLNSVTRLAQKKLRSYMKYDRTKQKNMLYAYLSQKGYPSTMVRSAVDIALSVK